MTPIRSIHIPPGRARTVVRAAATWLVAAVAASALLAPASHAQTRAPRALSVGLGGGATVPLGQFADDVRVGWHAQGHFQFQPTAEGPWAVRAEAQYHRAGYTDEFLDAVFADPRDDLHNTVLYAGASALYHAGGGDGGSGMRPYLIGGLGLYTNTATLEGAGGRRDRDSRTGVGFNAGVGMRLGGTTGLFVEARLHQFQVSGSSYNSSATRFIPLTVGFTF